MPYSNYETCAHTRPLSRNPVTSLNSILIPENLQTLSLEVCEPRISRLHLRPQLASRTPTLLGWMGVVVPIMAPFWVPNVHPKRDHN